MARGCELCEGVAALYCGADEAYVCWTCDAKVHSANFLVARHTRAVLCRKCERPTLWRASGANPTPLICLCAHCSDSECHSNTNEVTDESTQRVSCLSCVSVESSSSCESSARGCSAADEDISGNSAVDSEITGTLSFGDRYVSDIETRSGDADVQASASTIDSHAMKKSEEGCCKPASVLETSRKRTWEEAERSNSSCQCESGTSTSRDQDTQVEQGQDLQGGSQQPRLRDVAEGSGRSLNPALFFSMTKRRRINHSRHSRLSHVIRNRQPAKRLSSRILAKWHWDLQLSSPGTVPLSMHLFQRVTRALYPATLSVEGTRIILAVCLWLAAKLDSAQIYVPKASEVTSITGVSLRNLVMTEIQLLELLDCRTLDV